MVNTDNSTLVVRVSADYTAGFERQKPRHEDWRENYQLYRDKVIVNRLTQRQSVNVPLMKETIKTILSNIDDAPDVLFKSRSNNKQKEVFINEYWNWFLTYDKLVVKDIVDKKQVCLYGRSWKKLMIANNRICSEVQDPIDIIPDRNADPANIDGTALYIQHVNIYRTLNAIAANKNYDTQAVDRLKVQYATAAGLIKSTENAQAAQAKNEKLQDMGVTDLEVAAVGETMLSISENHTKLWNDAGYYEIWVIVKCDGEILMKKSLEDIIGKTRDHYWRDHYPFITWADDVERTDIYSDGVGDIVRTPNKVLNAWFSQLVENRTLRNFGMNYYDSTGATNFVPQTFEPAPWGWYPVPGDPNKIVKNVQVADLSESMDEMNFIIGMVERATAATAVTKGEESKGAITLGEIKLISDKALERITSMSKFYKLSTKEFAEKWEKMVEASSSRLEGAKLYKKSYKGNYFSKDVDPMDWQDEAGYDVQVTSGAEQDEESLQTIQKLSAIVAQFPGNVPLKKIYQSKLLDLGKLTPEEQKEVMDFEKASADALAKQNAMPGVDVAGGAGAPGGTGATPPTLQGYTGIQPTQNQPINLSQ